MTLQFTPQQQQAIRTFDRNLVVNAGAGSGKTTVLVERFVAMLLHFPEWELSQLVAITFTRAAAMEMRNRVRARLDQATGDEHTRVRAAQLLVGMGGARIMTIHALCAEVLRANAAAADVDPSFRVIEDAESLLLRTEALETTFAGLSESDPAALLALFDRVEIQRARQTLALAQFYGAEAAAMETDLEGVLTLWHERWQTVFDQGRVDLQRLLSAESAATIHAKTDETPAGLTCATITTLWDALESSGESFLSAVETVGRLRPPTGKHEAIPLAKEIIMACRDFLTAVGPPPGAEEAELICLYGRWGQHLSQQYTELKRRANALDFDDLERMAQELLAQPSVAGRYVGGDIRHLLVDEFQDTNERQWQIVERLAPLTQAGSLFIVGDRKQSIYAFRNADVSVFARVEALVRQRQGMVVALQRSQRSLRPLVTTFNQFFARQFESATTYPFEVAWSDSDPMEASLEPLAGQATVSLEACVIEPVNGTRPKTRALRTFEAARIAQRIHRLLASHQIRDKATGLPRATRYGDIFLLFRALSNAELYERALNEADIPFVTVAGRGYYERQEIYDVRNLLAALYDPGDNLAVASVLRSPMFGFSDELLLRLRRYEGTLTSALAQPGDTLAADDYPRVRRAAHILSTLAGHARRVAPADLLDEAMRATGYLAMLTGLPTGARQRRNVEKFVEMARQSPYTSLGDFTSYINQLSAAEVREGEAGLENENAVTLMTVHASKGLEAPIVFLPDLSRRPHHDMQRIFMDADGLSFRDDAIEKVADEHFIFRWHKERRQARDTAEKKRLLYVAMTRARDLLILSGTRQNDYHGILSQLEGLTPSTAQFETWNYTPSAHRLRRPNPTRREDTTEPRLLQPVTQPQTGERLRHFSVTQLGYLGAMAETAYGERDYRAARMSLIASLGDQALVDEDALPVLETVFHAEGSPVTQRLIGLIVHDAIRNNALPQTSQDSDYDDVLRSYAWRLGIATPDATAEAVRRARRLLVQYRASDLYAEIAAAAHVYYELPFTLRVGQRVLHGQIDVLYQRADGQWALADYKTSTLTPEDRLAFARRHVRQYYFQVGAYAEAVAERTGIMPVTTLYYVQHNLTVTVTESQWRPVFTRLENHITELLDESDDHAAPTSG